MRRRRSPLRMALPWVAIVLAGAFLAATVDPRALPFTGTEKLSAVFLVDGQAYFGHLEDVPWSDTVTLRDVYYFDDATKITTDLPVGLVKRGSELHGPADGMQIRRDRILGIEQVTLDSAVAQAIASQRALDNGGAR